MSDARVTHAIDFLELLQRLTDRDADALVMRLAGPALPSVFEAHTRSILDDVAGMLPAEVRAGVLNEVGSLMLLGYLVRASEDTARREPSAKS